MKPLTLDQIVCQSTPLCNAVELDMAWLEKPKHTRFCFDILFQCTLHHCASTMFFLSRKKNLLAFWLLTKSVSRKVNITSVKHTFVLQDVTKSSNRLLCKADP